MKMLKLLGSTLVELLNNLDFLHVGLALLTMACYNAACILHVGLARLTMLHAALT